MSTIVLNAKVVRKTIAVQSKVGIPGQTGATGAAGATGPAGADGSDGLSAYQVAVANDFIGTEAQWLASLVGATGPQGIQGVQGAIGATGPAGADGSDGAAGVGVPAGGTPWQVLAKASATDYDTQWATPAAGGSGGTFQRGATFVNVAGLSLPVNNVPVVIPASCTIVAATVLTQSGTGSCVIDIWKDSYANYPPTVADSICGASKPTISSGTKYRDTTLAGWTTAISAGDILTFKLDSVSGFTLVDITLTLEPT